MGGSGASSQFMVNDRSNASSDFMVNDERSMGSERFAINQGTAGSFEVNDRSGGSSRYQMQGTGGSNAFAQSIGGQDIQVGLNQSRPMPNAEQMSLLQAPVM